MFNPPQTRKTFWPVTLPAIEGIGVPEQVIYLQTTGGIWPGELTRPIQELIKTNAAAEAERQAGNLHGINMLASNVAAREGLTIEQARAKMFPEAAPQVEASSENEDGSETAIKAEVVKESSGNIFNYAKTLDDMKAIIQPIIPDDCKPDLMELQRAIASMILRSRLASTIGAKATSGDTVLVLTTPLFFRLTKGDRIEFEVAKDRYLVAVVAEDTAVWSEVINVEPVRQHIDGVGFLLGGDGRVKSTFDWTDADTDTLTSQRLAALYEFFMVEKAGSKHAALMADDEETLIDDAAESMEVYDDPAESQKKSLTPSPTEPETPLSTGQTSSNDAVTTEVAIAA
jgi:hypothetical protein